MTILFQSIKHASDPLVAVQHGFNTMVVALKGKWLTYRPIDAEINCPTRSKTSLEFWTCLSIISWLFQGPELTGRDKTCLHFKHCPILLFQYIHRRELLDFYHALLSNNDTVLALAASRYFSNADYGVYFGLTTALSIFFLFFFLLQYFDATPVLFNTIHTPTTHTCYNCIIGSSSVVKGKKEPWNKNNGDQSFL